MLKKYGIFLLLALYAVVAAVVAWFMDGTGDSGDGVMHYLFARYAPQHPELYFHHWAKPMFVLLASPFAQLGLRGVHFFNVLCALLTLFFTYKTAIELKLNNPLIVTVLMVFSPFYIVSIFSGLTEPLFALFTIVGVYLVIKERWFSSILLFSFLPFVRSEGLIIIGVIAFYLLLKRQWKWLPWLATGHVVYALAGWPIHGDLLWIFTKIPYAHVSSIYGIGTWGHFFEKLIYVTGIPIYILSWIGVFVILWKSWKKEIPLSAQVLVFLGFGGFFTAHTMFWALGIFNSMGLYRVFIGVLPLIGLIALYGYNFLVENFLKSAVFQNIISSSIIIILISFLFPFKGNNAALEWKRDFMLDNNQRVLKDEVGAWILANQKPGARKTFLMPYLNLVLNTDPFATGKDRNLTRATADTLRTGDLIIWDSWFARIEERITRGSLDSNATLKPVFSTVVRGNTPEIEYVIYEKR